jgi:F-type H+-transporting ATPase subunit delta
VRRGRPIARRYARALFAIGREKGDVRALLTEVETLADEVVGSDDLRRVLFAPIHPRSERSGVVVGLSERLGLCAEIRALGALLVEENRFVLLPAIRDALREAVDRAEGRVVAEVRTARPLEPAEVTRLTEALSRRVGARVTVSLEVDDGILGGVVARVGDLLLDGSVRTQLASLAGSLRRGSS